MPTPAERYIPWLDQVERQKDKLRAENERLRAALAECQRVSGERLDWIDRQRRALQQINADSKKLGVAPDHLGDLARRALDRPME